MTESAIGGRFLARNECDGALGGHPQLTRARAIAYDQTLAANLWQVSAELTGVEWGVSSHA